ncbi:MAG: PqqD family peptide modification chaperone [Planctomycetia bacterium]|nr:PqqD family peptide modification chaperone [Planctomycetia bacterium]
MESQKLYKIDRSNIVFETFDTEVVIINLDNGNYYSYDGLGVDIWGLLKDQVSINDLNKWIIKKYSQESPSEIKKMIRLSIIELESENLIISSESHNDVNKHANQKDLENFITIDKRDFKYPVLQRYTDMQDFLLVDPIHEIDYEKWPEKNNPQ